MTLFSDPLIVHSNVDVTSGDGLEHVFQVAVPAEAGGGSSVTIGSDLSSVAFFGGAPVGQQIIHGTTDHDILMSLVAALGLAGCRLVNDESITP